MIRRAQRVLRAVLWLRLKGVRFGCWPAIHGRPPAVDTTGDIVIGRHFRVSGLYMRAEIGAGPDGRLVIGDHVFLNRGVQIFAADSVTIGDYTRIADHVAIIDTDFHPVDQGAAPRVAPVVIGRNVWIGRGATVLPGVTIGDHTVIGAGAVVSEDVPDRTVAVGNPARSTGRPLQADDGWVRP